MNNCAIRTGLSGVMGIGLGAMFGVAMGTFDTAVSSQTPVQYRQHSKCQLFFAVESCVLQIDLISHSPSIKFDIHLSQSSE